MKPAPECYECLQRMISQAVDLATGDASRRHQVIREANRILEEEFSYTSLCIIVASRIHSMIRGMTGNHDPYRPMKEGEMRLARDLYPELSQGLRIEAPGGRQGDGRFHDLRVHIQMAAAANAIDYFRDFDAVRGDLRRPVEFAVDDLECLSGILGEAKTILYLADNAGEIYFDLLVVKRLKQSAEVVYVVKPEPCQNDLTLEDVKDTGLEGEFGRVMSTGIASPGVIFSQASIEFRRKFESADLIFAKGMGHYEALSELPAEGRFFHCLKAKCLRVSQSIGVPLNSYVAMLR
ncbi:MAG: damage-control phosphatase ARMT1 family protein [Dehalococcoidia bacterium]